MKLPANAKRVFKGIIFDVYHWEQKMYDGSTGTFEMLKRPDTAVVIPVVEDKILIMNEQQPQKSEPFVSIPGGRMEEGEDSLVAAKREMLEETGFISDDWELFQTHEPTTKIDWTIYIYIARGCRKEHELKLDAGEKITTRLISFEEFINLASDENFYEKELINYILRARLDKKLMDEFKQKLF